MSDHDRLWARYWGIRDNLQNGYAVPIIWHLALRRDPLAMIELGNTFNKPGRLADPSPRKVLLTAPFDAVTRMAHSIWG